VSEETGKQTPEETPAIQGGGRSGKGVGIIKLISGLAFRIILGHGKAKPGAETGDVSTRLAHARTDLALERNYLAADRTLMAWIRTALSMISFGFTIGKLGQVLHDVEVKGLLGRVRTVGVENIAYFLVILGTVSLVGASLQHWQRLREFRAMGLTRRFPMTFLIALLLALVGAFALTALILAL
jgi:putative membrane protein